jgi:hypothetical protein
MAEIWNLEAIVCDKTKIDVPSEESLLSTEIH